MLASSKPGGILNSIIAIGCDQVIERIDFSVDGFKRALAHVVLLTMRYVLACNRSLIKLSAIAATVVVFLQRYRIALTFDRPFKAGGSAVVRLRAITNLGSLYWRGQESEQQCRKLECRNTDHEEIIPCCAVAKAAV